jgi:F0F1-type ATP synthase membrane subunit b/b'
VGDISVDLAGRIVGESLDGKAHKALIESYLADLEKL